VMGHSFVLLMELGMVMMMEVMMLLSMVNY
jgi:hypothetical protein